MNMNSDHQTASTTQNTHCDVNRHGLPRVTVHVNSDKGLQAFRGDNTDKYPVQDWIELTKTHLRNHIRLNYPANNTSLSQLTDLYSEGGSAGHTTNSQTDVLSEAETIYTSVRDSCTDSEVVVYQNIYRAGSSDILF